MIGKLLSAVTKIATLPVDVAEIERLDRATPQTELANSFREIREDGA